MVDSPSAIPLSAVSPASFWFPLRSSFASGWAEHAPFGFWLVDAMRPKVLVELGTYKGYSFSVFCQAVKQLRLPTRCYAIDTWLGDEHAGFYGDEVYNELKSYIDEYYGTFARMVRSTFDEAIDHFEDGSVDFLHVDGRHHYEDAKHDYTSWIPKLAANAVVLFHDINVRENQFGVFRLWNELKSQNPHFEFLHCNGLGIIGVGNDLPDPIRRLFQLSDTPAEARTVQEIYSRLGRAVSHHYEVQHHGAEVVGALRGGIAERDEQIIALRSKLAKLQQEATVIRNAASLVDIQAAAAAVDTRDVTIDRLQQDISSQEDVIRSLQQSLKEANLRLSRVLAGDKTSV